MAEEQGVGALGNNIEQGVGAIGNNIILNALKGAIREATGDSADQVKIDFLNKLRAKIVASKNQFDDAFIPAIDALMKAIEDIDLYKE